jgi:hypothetical protein
MFFEFAAVDRTRQHDPVQMWPFWIDCSLSEIARWAAKLKMKKMVEGVKTVRKEIGIDYSATSGKAGNLK